jgi:hypothetical protein
LGRATGITRRAAGLVGTGAGRAATAGSRLGAACRLSIEVAGLKHFGRTGSWRRC